MMTDLEAVNAAINQTLDAETRARNSTPALLRLLKDLLASGYARNSSISACSRELGLLPANNTTGAEPNTPEAK